MMCCLNCGKFDSIPWIWICFPRRHNDMWLQGTKRNLYFQIGLRLEAFGCDTNPPVWSRQRSHWGIVCLGTMAATTRDNNGGMLNLASWMISAVQWRTQKLSTAIIPNLFSLTHTNVTSTFNYPIKHLRSLSQNPTCFGSLLNWYWIRARNRSFSERGTCKGTLGRESNWGSILLFKSFYCQDVSQQNVNVFSGIGSALSFLEQQFKLKFLVNTTLHSAFPCNYLCFNNSSTEFPANEKGSQSKLSRCGLLRLSNICRKTIFESNELRKFPWKHSLIELFSDSTWAAFSLSTAWRRRRRSLRGLGGCNNWSVMWKLNFNWIIEAQCMSSFSQLVCSNIDSGTLNKLPWNLCMQTSHFRCCRRRCRRRFEFCAAH